MAFACYAKSGIEEVVAFLGGDLVGGVVCGFLGIEREEKGREMVWVCTYPVWTRVVREGRVCCGVVVWCETWVGAMNSNTELPGEGRCRIGDVMHVHIHTYIQ